MLGKAGLRRTVRTWTPGAGAAADIADAYERASASVLEAGDVALDG
jgi:hypothetical protein